MSVILVIRSEIIDLLIMTYILGYSLYSGKYSSQRKNYFGLCLVGFLHVLFGLLTEITVNSDTCPELLNLTLHYCYFATAVITCFEYAKYILSLVYSDKKGTKIILWLLRCICGVVVVSIPFFPLYFLDGKGTKYSMGTGVIVAFGTAFAFFLMADILLLIFHRKIDKVVVYNVLPISFVVMICWVVQLLVTEFLFTPSSLTLLSLSLFLAIENPIGKVYDAYRLANNANKAKTDFLSSMSHEIRTPINAILGLNEMILRESEEDTIKDYSFDIKSSTKTMLSLVNDLLDLSKIEAGKMELIPVGYDFSSALNDVVNMINARAAEKKLDFIVRVDENLPKYLYGDEIRVKQIMTNILTNAVKYTKVGFVTLTVGFEKKGEDSISLMVRVDDTGIGMRKESMERLFTPFERIDEVSNRNIEGTGLGMSITQKFLALMDSKLEVESEFGRGSSFWFSIDQKVEKWEPIGDYEEAIKELRKSSSIYKPTFVAPDARVLVVDDNAMNVKVFRGLLKQSKMKIDSAESGKEALHLSQEHKYDLIFLDHLMPEMDGIKTLIEMNESEKDLNHSVPKIAMTANAGSGAREMYMQAGFSGYLSKPVDPADLEKMLAKYIKTES